MTSVVGGGAQAALAADATQTEDAVIVTEVVLPEESETQTEVQTETAQTETDSANAQNEAAQTQKADDADQSVAEEKIADTKEDTQDETATAAPAATLTSRILPGMGAVIFTAPLPTAALGAAFGAGAALGAAGAALGATGAAGAA